MNFRLDWAIGNQTAEVPVARSSAKSASHVRVLIDPGLTKDQVLEGLDKIRERLVDSPNWPPA